MENDPRRPEIRTGAVIGAEDQWVTTPVGTLVKIMGTGDVSTTFSRLLPRRQHPVAPGEVIELPNGKVLRETTIFGAAVDAPQWRAHWVERR
jgi:hypothetical protein